MIILYGETFDLIKNRYQLKNTTQSISINQMDILKQYDIVYVYYMLSYTYQDQSYQFVLLTPTKWTSETVWDIDLCEKIFWSKVSVLANAVGDVPVELFQRLEKVLKDNIDLNPYSDVSLDCIYLYAKGPINTKCFDAMIDPNIGWVKPIDVSENDFVDTVKKVITGTIQECLIYKKCPVVGCVKGN